MEARSSVEANVPYHNLFFNTEKNELEEHLGRSYLSYWRDDVMRLRVIFHEKTWFGFDLDDTLHEFRGSSGIATNKVLEKISGRNGSPMPELREEYFRVLMEKTANAFSDGKSSFDYRKERFTSVLATFSLPNYTQFMDTLLESYEHTLTESLQLKCGALCLLSTIKNMGKKIVIITEGPQDAQERTIQALGIEGYVDFIATTNHLQVTKTIGLFKKVLGYLGISPGDMAYIGDSEQRDMEPAMAEGIFSIHLDENSHVSLNAFPPHINTWRKLQ